MIKFKKYVGGNIRNLRTGEPSNVRSIRKLIADGIEVRLQDYNGKDITSKIDDTQIELKPVKLKACKHCGNSTVNYFRCTECLESPRFKRLLGGLDDVSEGI